MTVLFVELVDTDSHAPVRWWVCDDSEVIAFGTCVLANVAAEANERAKPTGRFETVVLLPDQEILYIEVEIPGRSQARVRQAAPFAVEPHLTEEIDDVHIALGDVQKSGVVPCMVINRSRLEAFMSVIEAAEFQPSVITTPGMLTIPSAGRVLIETGSTITMRTPDQLAVVAPSTLVSALSSTFLDGDQDATIKCVGTESIAVTTQQVIDQLEVEDVEIELVSFETLLASVKEPIALMNLQQGDYATKDSGVTIRQTLNKTALVAGVCLIMASAVFFAQGLWADYQTNTLREEALDIYESIYNTRDVAGNPVFRMQERLGARVDEQSKWLNLLESVVGATADVEIQNLDFNESQNRMGITFFADSYQEFEAIRARIENLGMSVEVNVAEQQANRVLARISLSMP